MRERRQVRKEERKRPGKKEGTYERKGASEADHSERMRERGAGSRKRGERGESGREERRRRKRSKFRARATNQ